MVFSVSINSPLEVEMPKQKYIVRLSTEERETLEQLVNKGKAAAYKRLSKNTIHGVFGLRPVRSEFEPGSQKASLLAVHPWTQEAVERFFDSLLIPITGKNYPNMMPFW